MYTERYNIAQNKKKESYSHHKQNVYINAFLDGIYHRESGNNCPVKTRISYASTNTNEK